MTNNLGFPSIGSSLPDMMDFVSVLAQDYRSGDIDSWKAIEDRVRSFFTPDTMAEVETVAPRWSDMACHADGSTLVHVMAVFTSLLLCPEFHQASRTQQELLKWIVFFHDIAKTPQKGQRDYTHGFRSAAMTAEVLPGIGFDAAPAYDNLIEDWVKLVNAAMTKQSETSFHIQDNRKLPKIIEGIGRLFGHSTPAALIIRTALLHVSVDVVEDWPQVAPLTDTEVKDYLDFELLPLLKVMMLVDNDSYTLFDKPTKERYRRETLDVFTRLRSLLSA
ncbi:hypothetical protein ES703_117312 [subsurface metagenome]